MRINEVKEGLKLWLWTQSCKETNVCEKYIENLSILDSVTNKKWRRREKLNYI